MPRMPPCTPCCASQILRPGLLPGSLSLHAAMQASPGAPGASPGPRTPPSARRSLSGPDLSDAQLFEAPADVVRENSMPSMHQRPHTAAQARSLYGRFATARPCASLLPPALQVCPLTLAPFVDPVLTSAGHVSWRGGGTLDGPSAARHRILCLPVPPWPKRAAPVLVLQVYERAAIMSHMERSNTDPLTRQPLLNKWAHQDRRPPRCLAGTGALCRPC